MEEFSEKEINSLTIKIDRTTCIATTNCIKVAPEVFELDDERICSFKKDLQEIEPERLTEACSVCPVDALYAINKEGEQIVPK
jgi:ferredoxin